MDLARLHTIDLVQIADNQSYTQTMAYLSLMEPVEIVLCKAQAERVLFGKILTVWGSDAKAATTKVSAINRRFFDDTAGDAAMRSLSCRPLPADLSSRYMAVAALNALLQVRFWLACSIRLVSDLVSVQD